MERLLSGVRPGQAGLLSGWWCKALADEAHRYGSFDDFHAEVESGALLADRVQSDLEQTTAKLRERDISGEADIPVADFILENYRDQRLFLTPVHPSNVLYRYVFERLRALTGIA